MMPPPVSSRKATQAQDDERANPAAAPAPLDAQDVRRSDEALRTTFEKVEQAKQEWEATADLLPELICVVDGAGRVVRANRTLETWNLGRVNAVKGLDLHRLAHPGCESFACELARALKQARAQAQAGQTAEFEMWDERLGRHIAALVKPIATRSGGLGGAAIMLQDITQRRRADAELRHYTERLEAMNDLLQAILAAHSRRDIAQAALDRMRKLVQLQQARVMLYDSDSDRFILVAAISEGGVTPRIGRVYSAASLRKERQRRPDAFYVVEDLRKLPDRSRLEEQWLNDEVRSFASIPLMAEGEFIGNLSIGVSAAAGFTPQHIAIAREVAGLLAVALLSRQLAERLKQASAIAEDAHLIRQEMLHNISHGLRTPLVVIKGYVDVLAEGVLGALTAEQTTAVGIIDQQVAQLNQSIEQLLLLRTLGDGSVHAPQRAPVAPGSWLRKLAQTWTSAAARRKIHLRLDIAEQLPVVAADLNQLERLMNQLLSNALKFSPDGSVVTIHAHSTADDLVVSVADEGIGIPADELERVFECFHKVPGQSRGAFEGMGIGLALCRAIVEAHDGRIWAESPGAGQGSVLHITLPVQQPAAEAP